MDQTCPSRRFEVIDNLSSERRRLYPEKSISNYEETKANSGEKNDSSDRGDLEPSDLSSLEKNNFDNDRLFFQLKKEFKGYKLMGKKNVKLKFLLKSNI